MYIYIYIYVIYIYTIPICNIYIYSISICNIYIYSISIVYLWIIYGSSMDLVGGSPTPLKNMSQLGWCFPIYGKIKMFQTSNQISFMFMLFFHGLMWMCEYVFSQGRFKWNLKVRICMEWLWIFRASVYMRLWWNLKGKNNICTKSLSGCMWTSGTILYKFKGRNSESWEHLNHVPFPSGIHLEENFQGK